MGKNLSDIRTIKDLNAEAWERVFSHHLGRQVKLAHPCQASDLKALDVGTNDQFNSVIVKTSIGMKDGDRVVTYHVVIKSPPDLATLKLMGRFTRPFMTESFVYHASATSAFQEISDLYPVCYFCTSNHDDVLFDPPACEKHCCCLCWCCFRKQEKGVIILEDLSRHENPYKTLSKTNVPTLKHVVLAMRALARYHGTWVRFLNSENIRRTDGSFSANEVKAVFRKDRSSILKALTKIYQNDFRSVIQLMKNRNEDKEFINRVERYSRGTFMERMIKVVKKDYKSARLETMIHGDFWINNFMFQEDDQGIPISIKFVDFQISAIGHPAVDLLYFFYISTDLDFRRQHLDTCLREYFKIIEGYLKPTLEMTYEEFLDEFNERRDLGIIGGLGVVPNVLSPNQVNLTFSDMRKMGRKRYIEIASPDKPDDHPDILEIRRRLLDLMKDFDEHGLLS